MYLYTVDSSSKSGPRRNLRGCVFTRLSATVVRSRAAEELEIHNLHRPGRFLRVFGTFAKGDWVARQRFSTIGWGSSPIPICRGRLYFLGGFTTITVKAQTACFGVSVRNNQAWRQVAGSISPVDISEILVWLAGVDRSCTLSAAILYGFRTVRLNTLEDISQQMAYKTGACFQLANTKYS